MPRTRDFSNALHPPAVRPDGRLAGGRPMTAAQATASSFAMGSGHLEAERFLSEGGQARDGEALARAARDALLSANGQWTGTPIRALFEVSAFHKGFRDWVVFVREGDELARWAERLARVEEAIAREEARHGA